MLPLVTTNTREEMSDLIRWGLDTGMFTHDRAGQLVAVEMAHDQDVQVFMDMGKQLEEAYQNAG